MALCSQNKDHHRTITASCWDRFDRKSLISFTGYKDRLDGMLEELDRIGMPDVNIHYTVPNPFDKVLLDHLPCVGSIKEEGYMNCTMGHYLEIKTSYCLGCRNCLIMEDDIRFLKDVKEIETIVNSLPNDFDIALFDLFTVGLDAKTSNTVKNLKEFSKVNDLWFRYVDMRSMGCYALSRDAMARLIWLFECAAIDPKVGRLRICDHFLNSKYYKQGSNLYGAVTNVAIQKIFDTSNTDYGELINSYRNMGLDLSKYSD